MAIHRRFGRMPYRVSARTDPGVPQCGRVEKCPRERVTRPLAPAADAAPVVPTPGYSLGAGNLEDRATVGRAAIGEPEHEQVAVGSGLEVGDDPEVRADHQAFALGEVVILHVVGDPILQFRIVRRDLLTVGRQPEAE